MDAHRAKWDYLRYGKGYGASVSVIFNFAIWPRSMRADIVIRGERTSSRTPRDRLHAFCMVRLSMYAR